MARFPFFDRLKFFDRIISLFKKMLDRDAGSSSPVIKNLSANEISPENGNARFEVSWRVFDYGNDLDKVNLTLIDVTDNSSEEDTASVDVKGRLASGTQTLEASGDDGSTNKFKAKLEVTDKNGDSKTQNVQFTEGKIGDPPNVDSLKIVEIEADTNNVDAHFDVDWQVSDSGENLKEVKFVLYDLTDDAAEDSPSTFDISGGSASGEDYRFLGFGDDGSGNEFEIRMTVFDENDDSTFSKRKITETENDQDKPFFEELTIEEVEVDSDNDAHFDVDWKVSDQGENLDTITFTFFDVTDNAEEDTASFDISSDSDFGGSSSGEASGNDFRFLGFGDDESGHEFEIQAEVSDTKGNVTTETESIAESEPDERPIVDSFSVDYQGVTDNEAEFSLSYTVSDQNNDLNNADVRLWELDSGGDRFANPENSTNIDLSGASDGTASGSVNLLSSGGDGGSEKTFEGEIEVFDSDGVSSVATDQEVSSFAPTVDSVSITEIEGTENAEFDVSWVVSDPNNDLSKVDVNLYDETDDEDEETATDDTLNGGSADGTTRVVASNDDGSGNKYTVTVTVTDDAGNTDSGTGTITETDVEPVISADKSFLQAKNEWENKDRPPSAFPLETDYHDQLYSWLSNLKADGSRDDNDVAVNGKGSVSFDTSANPDEDAVFVLWTILNHSKKITKAHINYRDENYTVSGGYEDGSKDGDPQTVMANINGYKDQGIQLSQTAWWSQLDMDGLNNPFGPAEKGDGGKWHENLKRKCMSEAVAEMIMLSWHFRNQISKDIGSQINVILAGWRDNVRTFYYCNDVLDDSTKYAFITAAMDVWKDVGEMRYPYVNENMATFGLAGAMYLWRLARDIGMSSEADVIIREWREAYFSEGNGAADPSNDTPNDDSYGVLFEQGQAEFSDRNFDESVIDLNNEGNPFDDGTIRPSGMGSESGGPKSSYLGMEHFFIGGGYTAVEPFPEEWGFGHERLRRMNQIMADFVYPDYSKTGNGPYYSSPTQFSGRTAVPLHAEQSSSPAKRGLHAQEFPDEAGHFVQREPGILDQGDQQKMKNEIASALNNDYDWTGTWGNANNAWTEREFGKRNDDPRNTWGEGSDDSFFNKFDFERWGARNGEEWWDIYEDGIWDKFKQWSSNDAPEQKLPVQKDDFIRHEKDHLRVKRTAANGREWSAHVVMEDQSGRWNENFGSLNAFWTPETNAVFQPHKRNVRQLGSVDGDYIGKTFLFNNYGGGFTDFSYDRIGFSDAFPSYSWDKGTLSSGLPYMERSIEKDGFLYTVRSEVEDDGIRMIYTIDPQGSSTTFNSIRMRWPVYRGMNKQRGDEGYSLGTFEEFRTRADYWNGSSYTTLSENNSCLPENDDGECTGGTRRNTQHIRLSRVPDDGENRGFVWMTFDSPVDLFWHQESDFRQSDHGEKDSFRSWFQWQWQLNIEIDGGFTQSDPFQFDYKIMVNDPT